MKKLLILPLLLSLASCGDNKNEYAKVYTVTELGQCNRNYCAFTATSDDGGEIKATGGYMSVYSVGQRVLATCEDVGGETWCSFR